MGNYTLISITACSNHLKHLVNVNIRAGLRWQKVRKFKFARYGVKLADNNSTHLKMMKELKKVFTVLWLYRLLISIFPSIQFYTTL